MTAPAQETLSEQHAREVARGERFEFGANWRSFLRTLDEGRIAQAEHSLGTLLGRDDLRGQRFLDIGSGSGLSSLAARRMGATVVSFDYDPESVGCTAELKRRYFQDDPAWQVESGSALDEEYLASIGKCDVVYSWGVLHHTGAMWRGIELAAEAVAAGGSFALAIYNDQGAWSTRWRRIKRFYCKGRLARALVVGAFVPFWVVRGIVADLVWGRNPLRRYRDYRGSRGMSLWHDWLDWLGGYPFEVAKPEAILAFLLKRGFTLRGLTTCGGSLGCNEYLFVRNGSPSAA